MVLLHEIANCVNCDKWFEFKDAVVVTDKDGTQRYAKNQPNTYYQFYKPNMERRVLCSKKCKDEYTKKF